MSALTYGPHQDQDAPSTVTIGHPRANGGERVEPVPQGLIDQRRQINTLAAGTLRRITDRTPA